MAYCNELTSHEVGLCIRGSFLHASALCACVCVGAIVAYMVHAYNIMYTLCLQLMHIYTISQMHHVLAPNVTSCPVFGVQGRWAKLQPIDLHASDE